MKSKVDKVDGSEYNSEESRSSDGDTQASKKTISLYD